MPDMKEVRRRRGDRGNKLLVLHVIDRIVNAIGERRGCLSRIPAPIGETRGTLRRCQHSGGWKSEKLPAVQKGG